VRINGRPIYYTTASPAHAGLTCQEFESLGDLPAPELAAPSQEIAEYALRGIAPAGPSWISSPRTFGGSAPTRLRRRPLHQLSPEQLRECFLRLKTQFSAAVHEAYRKDDCHNKAWCERILSTLFLEGNEAQAELHLASLSPEFFMQVEWLPGGRFEAGEFLFDSIFDEAAAHPEDPDLQRLCDPRAKRIILNHIPDYGDLQYINLGCVPESLSLVPPPAGGTPRRFTSSSSLPTASPSPSAASPLPKVGRGGSNLDEARTSSSPSRKATNTPDYCLDRRLGCRQLGMKPGPPGSRPPPLRNLSRQKHPHTTAAPFAPPISTAI
jgi:hypothetical protein